MHKKVIYFLVRGMRHHKQIQVILQLSRRATKSHETYYRAEKARLFTYEMFMVEIENKEPSSSQFPLVKGIQCYTKSRDRKLGTIPVITGTSATWPRRTEY